MCNVQGMWTYSDDHHSIIHIWANSTNYPRENILTAYPESIPEGGLILTLSPFQQLLQPSWCRTYCSVFIHCSSIMQCSRGSWWLGNTRSPHTHLGLHPGEKIPVAQNIVLRDRRMPIQICYEPLRGTNTPLCTQCSCRLSCIVYNNSFLHCSRVLSFFILPQIYTQVQHFLKECIFAEFCWEAVTYWQ